MRETWKWIKEAEEELSQDPDVHVHDALHKYAQNLTLEEIFTTDAVYLAACRCSAGFQRKRDTQVFMRSASLNAYRLAEKVKAGKFRPKYYKERTIRERGKERVIRPPTFESKVVQKVLCDYVIRNLFEHRMIQTNYASVRGRGADRMYRDILSALRKCRKGNVIVMTDFTGYFSSIDTGILRGIYERYIPDGRVVDLIMSFSPEEKGLYLGNETSQVPASYFPSRIDHELKDHLRVKHYFRYCDDILFIAEDAAQAQDLIRVVRDLSAQLHLVLKEEKIRCVPYGVSFVFCKERCLYSHKDHAYYRMINPRIPKNETRKLRAFRRFIADGTMTPEEAALQYRTVRGMIAHHENTAAILQKLDRQAASAAGT